MKLPTRILISVVLLLLASSFFDVSGQATKPMSPNALVANLYREHNLKRSPFFQTRSRARVDRYFTKRLADLIWKDAKTSKGEVGALDGDPLYNAQDIKIRHFAIGAPKYADDKAEVHVTFENLGQKYEFVFQLIKETSGWRIDDIKYGDGTTLVGILGGNATGA
jgi:Protein of unknown function (DUF3828)